jgi:large subunit ribosomal protein L13
MKNSEFTQRTYTAKTDEVERKWYVVDATDKTLGRFATEVATLLRGKHKPQYTPHTDTGDFVVVVNAEKIKVTGAKALKKEYYHNTQYPGGARFEKYRDVIATKPERIVENAVWGMIPHNNLGRKIFLKLKVYAGAGHPHVAQNPQAYQIN